MQFLTQFFMKPIILIITAISFCFSCKKENVQTKYVVKGNAEAKAYFDENIHPILESKCNSCHNYHNTSSTKYITFEKTSGNIHDIIKRIGSPINSEKMPPVSQTPLSQMEINQFFDFENLLRDQSEDLKINLKWTAFKFPIFDDRAGVSGTFENLVWVLKENNSNSIYEKLEHAELSIFTSSVRIGSGELKTKNVKDHFFAHLMPIIHCEIIEIDEISATVMVLLNGISQNITMTTHIEGNMFELVGEIEDLSVFNTDIAFSMLDAICGSYHQEYVWPDVKLELSILNFDEL